MVIDFLKRVKRKFMAALVRSKARREAVKAFEYDLRQFLDGAGALHPQRREAAVAEIVMGYHVLEKGLTMPRRRPVFGRPAATHLMNLIKSFESRFGADDQVSHAVSVLRSYSELQKGHCEPLSGLDEFLAAHPNDGAAVEPHVKRDDFFAKVNAPFPQFAASRHVVRHFAGKIPNERLMAALELAQTAPSACNRQHARVHVVSDPAVRDRLFAVQGGTRGFGSDVDRVLVVTADLSAIRWAWERHDAYVNGGIYVMNLAYALHYNGIAHCILHWSVPPAADREAHRILGIPPSEAIVQLLACGIPPEEFDVAASPRRKLDTVVSFNGGMGE